MLSLPLVPPQPLLHQTQYRPRSDSPPPSTLQTNTQQQQQQHRQQQRRNPDSTHNNTHRSPLALLAADEAAIAARKAAIRNFGAYWIRPPGVGKTLQAMNEAKAEEAEMLEHERQEQGLRDLEALQQVQERAGEAGEGEVEGGDDGERDLDDEIPDADGGDGVTFNEESLVEGSHFVDGDEEEELEQGLDLEEAELTGAARDQEDLGLVAEEEDDIAEHNLDDSIPEAGSYQHTDTEVEDSDSDSELQNSFAERPVARPGLQDRLRNQVGGDALTRSPGSLNLSSSVLESSFVGSSPVMQRGRGAAGRRARPS